MSELRADETLPAARVPRGASRAGWLGVVLSVVVLALGLVAVYDGITQLGWLDESPVLTPAVDTEVSVGRDLPTALLGVLLALTGLWLLWSALKPGRRRGAGLATSTGVWMSYRDLERLVAGTAEEVHGVVSARASVSRARARVSVQTTAPEVAGEVQAAVTDRLGALERPPRLTVLDTPKHDDGGEGR